MSHDPSGSCDTNGHKLPSSDEGREILPKIRELFHYNLTLCAECFIRNHLYCIDDTEFDLFTGLKHINSELYASSASQVFGIQTVCSLQLCAMMKKDKSGYYHVESSLELGLCRMRSLDIGWC